MGINRLIDEYMHVYKLIYTSTYCYIAMKKIQSENSIEAYLSKYMFVSACIFFQSNAEKFRYNMHKKTKTV